MDSLPILATFPIILLIGLSSSISIFPLDASRHFEDIPRSRCPVTNAHPVMIINQKSTGLVPSKSILRTGNCRYVAQCDVSSNPPEVGFTLEVFRRGRLFTHP